MLDKQLLITKRLLKKLNVHTKPKNNTRHANKVEWTLRIGENTLTFTREKHAKAIREEIAALASSAPSIVLTKRGYYNGYMTEETVIG